MPSATIEGPTGEKWRGFGFFQLQSTTVLRFGPKTSYLRFCLLLVKQKQTQLVGRQEVKLEFFVDLSIV